MSRAPGLRGRGREKLFHHRGDSARRLDADQQADEPGRGSAELKGEIYELGYLSALRRRRRLVRMVGAGDALWWSMLRGRLCGGLGFFDDEVLHCAGMVALVAFAKAVVAPFRSA